MNSSGLVTVPSKLLSKTKRFCRYINIRVSTHIGKFRRSHMRIISAYFIKSPYFLHIHPQPAYMSKTHMEKAKRICEKTDAYQNQPQMRLKTAAYVTKKNCRLYASAQILRYVVFRIFMETLININNIKYSDWSMDV